MQTFPQLQPFAAKVAACPCCYPCRRRFAVTCQRTFPHPNPAAKVRLSLDFGGGFRGQLFPVSFRWLKTLYIALFLPSSGLGRPLVLPFSGEPYGGGFHCFAILCYSLLCCAVLCFVYQSAKKRHLFPIFARFLYLWYVFLAFIPLFFTPYYSLSGVLGSRTNAVLGTCFRRTRELLPPHSAQGGYGRVSGGMFSGMLTNLFIKNAGYADFTGDAGGFL